MTIKLFLTGTDTGIGKTYISVGLLNAARKKNVSTLGIKPIASGCTEINGILQNEDALLLQQASTLKLPYHHINPFAFQPPIAPHIAAKQVNSALTVKSLIAKTDYALQSHVDLCVVEGVGGWNVPLNTKETMADYVKETKLKVLLVVGIRLGCLNHAILTYRAIEAHGVEIMGWIANSMDPNMPFLEENIETLKTWLPVPCLAEVAYAQIENTIDISF